MPRSQDIERTPPHNPDPSVPTKEDILRVLQQDDSGRAGLQLEWVLDRYDTRERRA